MLYDLAIIAGGAFILIYYFSEKVFMSSTAYIARKSIFECTFYSIWCAIMLL
jgi:hypothetical protein